MCQVSAAQRLFRVRSWFTLFFLPIFPLGHGTYVMQCAHCGRTSNLAREGAEKFIADARALEAEHQRRQDSAAAAPAASLPQPAAADIVRDATAAAPEDAAAVAEENTER